MTNEFIIASRDEWARKFSDLRVMNDAMERETDRKRKTKLSDKVVEIQEALITMPAPDLGGVIEKLLMLWDEKIWADGDEARFMTCIIGDLRRMEALSQ